MASFRHLDDEPFVGIGRTGPTFAVDEDGRARGLDLHRNRAETGGIRGWRRLTGAIGRRRLRRSGSGPPTDDRRTARARILPIRLHGWLWRRFDRIARNELLEG